MRTRPLWPLAILLAAALPASLHAGTSVGISVNLGSAPPPPVVVYARQPRLVAMPGSMVYVVDESDCDYDFFHVGASWYIYRSGYWYRGHGYRGPYETIAVREVPPGIFRVPERRWKHPHGGPPGRMKRDVVVVRERGGRHGHGRDRD
jgi:hypothetical protein